jgi:hypothetical protein
VTRTADRQYRNYFSVLCGVAIFLLLCPGGWVYAQTPGKTFGGTDNEQGFSIAVLSDGNYAIVGRTRSEGAGGNDAWALKVSTGGRLLWSRTIGSELLERAHWVEATVDGGMVVLGYSNGLTGRAGGYDCLLVKYDRDGEEEWRQLYGGSNREIGFCVREKAGGGYALLGYSRSFGDWEQFYLVGTDESGVQEWEQAHGTRFVEIGHELEQTPDGGFMLLGSEGGFYFPTELEHASPHAEMVLIRTDSLGNSLWYRKYGGHRHEMGRSLAPAADGGWYLFGSTQSQGAGSFDQFLLKVDANGDSLWSRTWGGPDWDYGNSIDVDAEGNLYLLGTSSTEGNTGSPDIWLRKTDADGNSLWALTLGGAEADYGFQVRALPQGGCLLVGATRSYGQGGEDVYFVRVRANGQIDLFTQVGGEDGPVIFPVPVTGVSTVDPAVGIGAVDYEWRVYDVAGRLLVREMMTGGQATRIGIGDLAQGVYLYEVLVEGQKRLSGRFLVKD